MAKGKKKINDGITAPPKRNKFLYARIKEINSDFTEHISTQKGMSKTQYIDLLLDRERAANGYK